MFTQDATPKNRDNLVAWVRGRVGFMSGLHQLPHLDLASNWYVGVTDDPNKRIEEHRHSHPNLKFFWASKTLNESDGRQAEQDLINLGFDGGVGGGGSASFLYVFRKH